MTKFHIMSIRRLEVLWRVDDDSYAESSDVVLSIRNGEFA